MKVTTRTADRIRILEISGTVDLYEGYVLREEIRKNLRSGSRYLVFDCRGITYVDSTGLGIFMHAREMAQDAGGAVALVDPGPAFQKILTTTQVNRLLPIFDTIEEALAEFGG